MFDTGRRRLYDAVSGISTLALWLLSTASIRRVRRICVRGVYDLQVAKDMGDLPVWLYRCSV